jgi:integrase/recombinase XerC/integrase/recombinase XerD
MCTHTTYHYLDGDKTMSERRNGNGHRQRNLAGLIDVYLLRCEVEGKSPNTLHAYRETLGRFTEIAQEEGFHGDVCRIAPAHLYAYLGRYTGYSLETRHRYFREVRCFFNWLVDAGYLKETPFRSLRNVRLPQKIVQPFSGEEIARLLACCDPETTAGARDRAIILTLLDTGVRVGELVRLTVEDFDFERQRLRVLYGKGNKQRIVRFGDQCREAVMLYIRRFCGAGPGPVFRDSRRDLPLQNNGVKQMLRRLGRQAGVDKVHAHRFRHTFATWAIENQARELDVQYLLGHSTPDMVRRYSATYNSEKAARAHEAFSPADRLGERLAAAAI